MRPDGFRACAQGGASRNDSAATIGVSIPPQFQSCPVHPDFLKIDVICFTVSDARRDGPESSLNFGKTSSQ
jgi:hypothetical protein